MSCTRAAFVFILGCLFGLPAYGQENSCQRRTIPVSLETKDAGPAPEISSANLEASYKNKPVQINLVTFESRLPRIMLLLDTSASMQRNRNQVINLAEELLSKLPPPTEVGLAFFAKEVQPIALPTTDREKLKYQLEGLRRSQPSFRGKTALWASVLGTLKMLHSPLPGDVIFLISDGENNESNLKEDNVALALTSAGVRIFGLVVQNQQGIRIPSQEATSRIQVWQMIENTGGTGVAYDATYIGHFPSAQYPPLFDKTGQPTQFGIALEEQRRQLSTFYRVEINLPETVDKTREWKLNLTGFSKPQRDTLILRYPRLLAPCH